MHVWIYMKIFNVNGQVTYNAHKIFSKISKQKIVLSRKYKNMKWKKYI